MDPKVIFRYKYERLRELLKGGNRAQLLDMASILRHLLVDEQTLFDIVNREFRLKIRFKVFETATEYAHRYPNESPPTFVFVGTVWPPKAPLKEITRDQFLDFDMFYSDGQRFTVRQIIKVCANKLGGVHYESKVADPEEAELRNLNEMLDVGGAPGAFASLQLIGNTTVEALNELYENVLKAIERPPASGSAP